MKYEGEMTAQGAYELAMGRSKELEVPIIKKQVEAVFKQIKKVIDSNGATMTGWDKELCEGSLAVLRGAPYHYKITGGYSSDSRDEGSGGWQYYIDWKQSSGSYMDR